MCFKILTRQNIFKSISRPTESTDSPEQNVTEMAISSVSLCDWCVKRKRSIMVYRYVFYHHHFPLWVNGQFRQNKWNHVLQNTTRQSKNDKAGGATSSSMVANLICFYIREKRCKNWTNGLSSRRNVAIYASTRPTILKRLLLVEKPAFVGIWQSRHILGKRAVSRNKLMTQKLTQIFTLCFLLLAFDQGSRGY